MRIVAVFLAALLMIGSAAWAEASEVRIVASEYIHPDVATPDVPQCEQVEDERFGKAVLVGDSLADGLGIHDFLPELQLMTRIGLSPRTAASDKLFKNNEKQVTLAQKLPAMRPDAVYLWLGSNGLVGQSAEKVIEDYDRLLNKLITALPNVPFYLLEVTPVRTPNGEKYANFTNERIDTFNEMLREVAQRHNVYIIETNAYLKDEEGLLAEAYAAEDSIHLLSPAYEIIASQLYTRMLPVVEVVEEETEETLGDVVP